MADGYDPSEFPPFAVTADIVMLTVRNGALSVLLVQRGIDPYKGFWALPGGFVKENEDLEEAARRELGEETGLAGLPGHLEQLRTYGTPGRDPRMRVVSVAYVGFAPNLPLPVGGDDADAARIWNVSDVAVGKRAKRDQATLAFDHAKILTDAIERTRDKLEYTPLATAFVDEPFTIADLRRVYQSVWGVPLHEGNFRRKVLSTPGFVEEYGEVAPSGSSGGRPAVLYRRGSAELLHPAMLRPND